MARALQRLHPDRGGSAALFRIAHAAYTVLTDAEKRARYDAGALTAEPVQDAPWEDVAWVWPEQTEHTPSPRPKRIVLSAFAVFMILLVLLVAVPLFVPNAPTAVSSEMGVSQARCT